MYNIAEECAETRLDILLLEGVLHGEHEFILFQRNGNRGENPLFHGIFVEDSIRFFEYFLPLALDGEDHFFGHTSASLQKNLDCILSTVL